MNTLMNILTVVLLVATLVALLVALLHTIRNDGYGQRPGPRSHRDIFAERASDLRRVV